MSKSPRMKGSEEKEIWIDTRIPLVKDPRGPAHFSPTPWPHLRSNKLDSSNSTPIVHSPFDFPFANPRVERKGISRFRNCQSFPRLFHRSTHLRANIFTTLKSFECLKKGKTKILKKQINSKKEWKERKKGKRIDRWNIELPFNLSTFSGV